MQQTEIDNLLRTASFKRFLTMSDTWGQERGFSYWPNRMAWVAVAFGPQVAKRFAQRRSNYQTSRAWAAYCNLVNFGVVLEGQGVVYEPDDPTWGDEADPYAWMEIVVQAADGVVPPEDFPRG